ncbi:MAG TPA: hypothetical protein VHE81_18265, partial [Lacipirellulaceae bacterium]|nr:hypothetical protein [Lacipirellulaceae bacterium]
MAEPIQLRIRGKLRAVVAKRSKRCCSWSTTRISFRLFGVYRPVGGLNLIGITEKLRKIGKISPDS